MLAHSVVVVAVIIIATSTPLVISYYSIGKECSDGRYQCIILGNLATLMCQTLQYFDIFLLVGFQ